MFGRKKDTNGDTTTGVGTPTFAAPATGAPAKTPAAGPRAVSAPADLLRRAEWETLPEAERARLLQPFAGIEPPAFVERAAPSPAAVVQLQDWVARLAEVQFQPEVAAAVQDWLTRGAPDAHLYVGGRNGQGRTSLVCSLARRAMAERPAPDAYCYVPDPDALDKAILLPLPKGVGADFGRTLALTLGRIAQAWDGDDESHHAPADEGHHPGDGQAAQAQPAAPSPRQARASLFDAAFAFLAATTPGAAMDYLARLRGTLEALSAADDTLPFDADDVPVAHVHPEPDDLPGAADGLGAPVVAAPLAQTELADALLRANGGVLALQAADILDAKTWGMLSTALRSRSLPLKDGWPPVPVSTRVVLVGPRGAYDALTTNTDDFARIFRCEIWCDWDTAWDRRSEAAYAAFAAGVSVRYGLPSFAPSAVSRLVEEAARRTDGLKRSRLSTDLLLLHDLAAESARTARARGATATAGDDVEAMLARRRQLQSVVARRVREAILTGAEMTETSGWAIGQINGLGIYETHPTEGTFAVPMRISATASVGRDERVIDIEREAEQADADHVRGEMTMEGFLNSRYGQARPISLVARIRFEQEHGATGGDSASAAELFALLSALAQVPLRRSFAVTGAVGQYGEIQPIGGVNIKIEGFWEICRARREAGERPDGGYAVLIPAVNARDLMLRPEVARSIAEEAWFHIYPIATVDDGLPLLTGLAADEIHQRVDARLQRFAELAGRTRQNQ